MTDTSAADTSASDGDSTRTVYGAARVPRRVQSRGGGGAPGRGTTRHPLVAGLQVDAIPCLTTRQELVRTQERIAPDQAYILPRHRLPIPSSWSAEEANGHIVPGSRNNAQTTRRAAGPLPPTDWRDVDPTQGTFGTFIEEAPAVIRRRQAEWQNTMSGGAGAGSAAASMATIFIVERGGR